MKAMTIAGVNLRRFLRERSNIFFVFIFPLALVLVLGAMFGGGFSPRIGIVEGSTPGSVARELVSALDSMGGFQLTSFDSEDELVDAIERGQVSAGVVIPDDYDTRLGLGQQATIGFVTRPDGGGATMRLALQAAIADQAARLGAARFVAEETGTDLDSALAAVVEVDGALAGVEIQVATVGERIFGEDVQQFDLGAPSQLVLFMFLTGLTASAAVIQSRQLGVSRRMLSTPTSASTIVIGEALGRFGVTLFQGAYIMAATWIIFGVHWGNALGAVALLVAFSLVGAGAGLLMGSVFSNDQQAGGIAVVGGLGLAALGGCMVPLEIFSPTMQTVAKFTPHAWALDGFAELVRRGGSFGDILVDVAVLVAYATGLLALAAWRLRRAITA